MAVSGKEMGWVNGNGKKKPRRYVAGFQIGTGRRNRPFSLSTPAGERRIDPAGEALFQAVAHELDPRERTGLLAVGLLAAVP
jgi:hypothetical protein